MMLLAFPAAVMVIGAIATAFDSERAERQQWQQFSANAQVNAGIQADRLQAESQLAETRYASNACVLSQVPLTPGMTVSGLNPGSAICDNQGTTALVASDGTTLTDFARTNNTAVVRRFLGWLPINRSRKTTLKRLIASLGG
ncbi:MAG TPA: hypothetical protein V6D02_04520 [Candidatus Obscuribacterales bacterium]